MGEGFGGGTGGPGVPAVQNQGNNVVSGGTGAFFGVRGQWGTTSGLAVAVPLASVAEDPSNRRTRATTGKFHQVIQLIPYFSPSVVATDRGLAVYHASDSRRVSRSRPAAPGEDLFLLASDLGPTNPNVASGTPFPASPVASVNSPLHRRRSTYHSKVE